MLDTPNLRVNADPGDGGGGGNGGGGGGGSTSGTKTIEQEVLAWEGFWGCPFACSKRYMIGQYGKLKYSYDGSNGEKVSDEAKCRWWEGRGWYNDKCYYEDYDYYGDHVYHHVHGKYHSDSGNWARLHEVVDGHPDGSARCTYSYDGYDGWWGVESSCQIKSS